MVMDKGLSIRQVEDMISSSSKYIDIVKLGFGTAYLTENLEKKIKLYQEANFRVYFGGTLFESFIARDMFKEYKELVHRYQLDTVEVSDGCITLDHEKKNVNT
jgi:phosphosulfolactate synthase